MASLFLIRRVSAINAPSLLVHSPSVQHISPLLYRSFSTEPEEKEKKIEISVFDARKMLHLQKKDDGKIITESEVKTAYRKRANDVHPDKGGSAEDFKELKLCYDIALGAARHEVAQEIRQDGLKSWKSNMRKKRGKSGKR